MTSAPTSLADRFWTQGFLHLENFFDEGEIANCAFGLQRANELSDLSRSNHWAQLETVQTMIFSAKVLRLATKILGEVPVFFGRALDTYRPRPLTKHYPVGHPDFQVLTKDDPKRFLHIDAKGTQESLFAKRSKMHDDRYPVIRFAHYFQDHSRYSYGIKLAPGSHRDGDPDNVESLYNPPLRPCDLLVFNLKTVHSAKCLLHRSGRVLTPSQEDALETKTPHEFLPAPVTRNVLAWDFCSMARESELFIRNRAFYELSSWHILATQLDNVSELLRLVNNGSLIVRHDTEISRLRALQLLGKLSSVEEKRLEYLESISPCVIPLADDIRQFKAEIRQAIKNSELRS